MKCGITVKQSLTCKLRERGVFAFFILAPTFLLSFLIPLILYKYPAYIHIAPPLFGGWVTLSFARVLHAFMTAFFWYLIIFLLLFLPIRKRFSKVRGWNLSTAFLALLLFSIMGFFSNFIIYFIDTGLKFRQVIFCLTESSTVAAIVSLYILHTLKKQEKFQLKIRSVCILLFLFNLLVIVFSPLPGY